MTVRSTSQSRAIKAKGRDAENAVVEWLRANGRPYVERRRLTGSFDQGDLAGLPGTVVEVKAEKAFAPAAWLAELEAEIHNAAADTGVVIAKRRGTTDVGEWYAILPVGRWLALLTEAGR